MSLRFCLAADSPTDRPRILLGVSPTLRPLLACQTIEVVSSHRDPYCLYTQPDAGCANTPGTIPPRRVSSRRRQRLVRVASTPLGRNLESVTFPRTTLSRARLGASPGGVRPQKNHLAAQETPFACRFPFNPRRHANGRSAPFPVASSHDGPTGGCPLSRNDLSRRPLP